MSIKKGIIGILASTILITNVAYAKANNISNEITNTKEYIQQEATPTHSREHECRNCHNLKEKYNQLFEEAEKYVPGIAEKGEQLHTERMNLKRELGSILKEKKDIINLKEKEEMKKEISNIMKQIEEGKITSKEGERQLEKRKEEYKKQINKSRKAYRKEHKKEIKARKAQKEKTKEAFEKFVKAVESKDAAEIEKSFCNYYENSKMLNEMLIKYIDSVKNQ